MKKGVKQKARTEDPSTVRIFPARPQSQSSGSLFANFPVDAIIGSFWMSKARIASLRSFHCFPNEGLVYSRILLMRASYWAFAVVEE
jgi:hypothetical protein